MNPAYIAALKLLSARELSEAQIRTRLLRREHDPADVDDALARLKADGTLDDRRVAVAAARLEGAIRHRGRTRVLQKLRQIGIDGPTAESAVAEVFEEVDEGALLDQAVERSLRGAATGALDDKARARIVRRLSAQGFAFDAILKRLPR